MNQVKGLLVATVFAALAAGGCGPGAGASDDHEAVGRDVAESVVETFGPAKTLTALVAPMLGEDSGGATAAGSRLQQILSEQLVNAGCVTVSWVKLRATVDFDDCQLLDTGAALDGAMTVVVRPLKLQVAVTLEDLTVGEHSLTGTMTGTLTGLLGGISVRADADLTLDDDAVTLVADGLSVVVAKNGATVSGDGAVISDKVDATTTLDQVHWKMGDCLPTSGSVAFVQGRVQGTLTFLETTPDTGEVELKVAPFDPTTVTLPFTCP